MRFFRACEHCRSLSVLWGGSTWMAAAGSPALVTFTCRRHSPGIAFDASWWCLGCLVCVRVVCIFVRGTAPHLYHCIFGNKQSRGACRDKSDWPRVTSPGHGRPFFTELSSGMV